MNMASEPDNRKNTIERNEGLQRESSTVPTALITGAYTVAHAPMTLREKIDRTSLHGCNRIRNFTEPNHTNEVSKCS